MRSLDGNTSYQRATIQKIHGQEQLAHHNKNERNSHDGVLSDKLKNASAPLMPLATLTSVTATDNLSAQ